MRGLRHHVCVEQTTWFVGVCWGPGLVIQANGRLSFEAGYGPDACFTAFHSESASALNLETADGHFGEPLGFGWLVV